MNAFWVILALIFVLLYVLSPIDGVPDMVPLLGWLDDTALVGILIYFLRTGRLPGFLSGIGRLFKNRTAGPDFQGKTGGRPESHRKSSRHASNGAATEDSGEKSKDPYEILGLSPGASREEIHAAYRTAAQQYHPDKVAHLGVEFQELARRKFLEIQSAYELLMKENP